jgi:uncharacterized Zn finger protein
MDTGEGKFVELLDTKKETIDRMKKEFPSANGIFSVGEEITIKGSLFRVKEISPFGIKLKLLRQK